MRIATSQFYSSSVATMDDQQAELAQLEQEISTGQAISTPSDNPLGAAQAVQLSTTVATYTQYSSNQNVGLSSLQLESTTLSSVISTMQSINTQLQSVGGGTLNNTDLQGVAQDLTGLRNELYSLANTTDGQGNYLFGGFGTTDQPFTNAAGGGVTYNGDDGDRSVQVTATRQISVSDPGSSVFMSVQPLNSSPVPGAPATNTGTGAISAPTITVATATTNDDNYSIVFGGTAAAPTYTVTDNSTTPPTASAATAYTAGTPIALGTGATVTITGAPNPGDTFAVRGGTSSASPPNLGTATVGGVSVSAPGTPTNNDQYTITFMVDPSGATTNIGYEVTDNSQPLSASNPAAWTQYDPTDGDSQSVSLGNGMSVPISGAPEAGDTFTVTPPQQAGTDIFAALDSIIATLNQPTQNDPQAEANLTNALSTVGTQLSNALANVTTIQASVGGRAQEMEAMQTVTSVSTTTTQTNLDTLTSVDATAVISQFEEMQTALTASQETFAKIQGMSLFQDIGN